jgi:formyltetrahydrofolate-dependent phosphoribosylglycinamide formyltransferase
MIKLGVLGSTKGTDLQKIIETEKLGQLKAKLSVVISNKKDAYILERAKAYNIPAIHISLKKKTREMFESRVTLVLEKYHVDLILLIGFMRILSAEFCQTWKNKIINVHPSLLPKYSGGMDSSVHEQVLKSKDIESGCTIHYVTEQVDAGQIIMQKRCQIEKNETVETLKSKVQQLEGEAFVQVINKLGKQTLSQ